MKQYYYNLKYLILAFMSVIIVSCSDKNEETITPNGSDTNPENPDGNDVSSNNDNNEVYADIDFSNWKVTLPVDENNNGKPDEYQPEALKNYGYQTLEPVMPFMYDDTDDSSLIFYTYPESSTTNSSYSRTELRELINPSNSKENWTLLEGGEMTGRLKVKEVSENNSSNYDYHRIIVMQIHGIISEEDVNTNSFNSNNGPPLIKIYWVDGYVWCHKKSLVDENTTGNDLIQPYSSSNNLWTDDKDNLGYVGYDAFDFRITASDAKIEVQLNDDIPIIYQDISLDKWRYENYFKAGNYLITTDANAFSYVKYYNLSLTH
ncbi:polysaccharide lyase family 7 protein [Winogradskyella haliclonae]|uniref:Alginate lyase 2 domain-containing protein n=1 Tax=Winogradskyella haliclonae TaxID=2048558 RepID=A0ABQ2BXX3_9FLAO|nr:polysaccharide lyase family 7 protein [Winogradskyella haliclonae]GGI56412.1 hypothetical protein GCM10011444_07210 [Winogradskyella haliclonae]